MPGTARLYAKHYFRPWVYRKEQSHLSVTSRNSVLKMEGMRHITTFIHVNLHLLFMLLWAGMRQGVCLHREGQEFGKGMVRIACLRSPMSGVSAWRVRLQSPGDFFTHPAGTWAGMSWKLGSAGPINWGPYTLSLHVAQAWRAGKLNSKREHSESDHFRRTKQKLHGFFFFLTQSRILTNSTST